LSVRAVITTGDSLDPTAVKPANNVAVFANADHDALMRRASLVVTHGGHGTMMRALAHGLPMVVIPGLAADQPINAAAIAEWGAGRALPKDSSSEAIRAGVTEVLGSPAYTNAAKLLSQKLKGADGARDAANEIGDVLRLKGRSALEESPAKLVHSRPQI
jgi:UDP:flavonoid glycosyltransferase YjiC (YdhE family)